MRYSFFGKTNMKLSELGLGGNLKIVLNSETFCEQMNNAADLLAYGIENGINYIDTAPTYCGGYEEEIVSMALKKTSRKVYVGSKAGLTNCSGEKDVLEQIERSLKTLDREYIDIFFLWSIMSWEDYKLLRKKNGIYDGIIKAQKEGMIHNIGASFHCFADEAIRIMEDVDLDGIIVSFNPINYKANLPIIKKAAQKKIGVMTMNSLAGGLVPQYPELFSNLEKSDRPSHEKSLRFIRSFPEITVALSGMEKQDVLDANLRAYEDDIDIRSINKSFELNLEEKLCSGCGYCLPCPSQVRIPQLMHGFNMQVLVRGDSKGNEHDVVNNSFVAIRGNGGDPTDVYLCKNCKKCEKTCTQKLPITDRIKTLKSQALKYSLSKDIITKRLDSFFEHYSGYKIGLWPTCKYLDEMLSFYNRPDIEEKVFFFNSSESLKNVLFRNKTVYGQEDLIHLGIQVILITNYNYTEEIFNMLKVKLKDTKIDVVKLQDPKKDIAWFW